MKVTEETYYVKSFEEDHTTKTLVQKEKKTFQTLVDILATNTIKPNTRSFGQQRRLSTTVLHGNYTKTYRPQGIIFQTDVEPNYVLPFDLVLLSDAKEIIVHYYRIKDNLSVYYNHKLINGFEKFIFKTLEELIEEFPSPIDAWVKLNEFRVANGHESLPRSKYRLVEYNEAVFLRPIKIRPIALFGYRPETRKIAKEHGLSCFSSAGSFYERKGFVQKDF